MTENMRPNEGSQPDVFKNNDMPPRGFISEILTLITHPIVFFTELGNRRSSPHTLWIAILILLMMSVIALQMPADSSVAQPDIIIDNGGMPPFDSQPFDPGFPPDGGGIPQGEPASDDDPTARWTIVLTLIFKQVVQWGALMLLLSLVTLANGYMPPFGKNLEIAIWASAPLALMAGLQLAFTSGGGTITATGLSGFLDEWATFATLDVRLQSIVHAFAEQLTLFWLWGLWLLVLGMRYTLRGKLPVILFTIVMWVVLSGLVLSLHSYEVLSNTLPAIEELMPEDFSQPEDFFQDEGMPPMDVPLTDNYQPEMEQPITHDDGEFSMPIEDANILPEGK